MASNPALKVFLYDVSFLAINILVTILFYSISGYFGVLLEVLLIVAYFPSYLYIRKLKQQFYNGEITKEEYESKRKELAEFAHTISQSP